MTWKEVENGLGSMKWEMTKNVQCQRFEKFENLDDDVMSSFGESNIFLATLLKIRSSILWSK